MPQLRISTGKKFLFAVVTVVFVFAAMELVLALVGIRPVLFSEDPFVGFKSSIPLYVEQLLPNGTAMMVTAQNKLNFFNPQEFTKVKSSGAYRIFCMGGSTTFGSPYVDVVSFAGWLRALLPAADPSRRWEVINAGGISYASYRVALLMEELVRYKPDLFIVYSGHNEFLEERTYRTLRQMPAFVSATKAVLSHTRLYAAVRSLVRHATDQSIRRQDQGQLLDSEVNTILDRSVGPSAYHRDDIQHAQIIEHYRISLNRMVGIARSVGAEILFVTPASNLKDCAPFKSEHRSGLNQADQARVASLFAEALKQHEAGDQVEALKALEAAQSIDDRVADLWYLKGRILFDLRRYEESKAAFVRARDEDICPLRALSPLVEIVRQTASAQGAGLIDFVEVVDRNAPHGIAGSEGFLDHVHPTIAGNRVLALAIIDELARRRVVKPVPDWGPAAIDAVAQQVQSQITPKRQAFALNHLSLLSGWAGRFEEAARLLDQALSLDPDNPEFLHRAGLNAHRMGNKGQAVQYFQRVLALDPNHAEAHERLGVLLSQMGGLDEGLIHLREAVRLRPENAEFQLNLGTVLQWQRNLDESKEHLLKALRLKPDYAEAHHALAGVLTLQGQITEAFKYCRNALQVQPGFLPAQLLFGTLLAAQGKIPECIAHYEETARLAPQAAPQIFLGLATVLTSHREKNMAVTYLRKAEQINPGDADFSRQLAEAYRSCGLADDAARVVARHQPAGKPQAIP